MSTDFIHEMFPQSDTEFDFGEDPLYPEEQDSALENRAGKVFNRIYKKSGSMPCKYSEMFRWENHTDDSQIPC